MGIFRSISSIVKSILKPKSQEWNTYKSVLIRGCDAGSVGASLAIALARKSIRVFATCTTLTAMSEFANHPNMTVLTLDPASQHELETTMDMVKTLLNGETLNALVNAGDVGLEPPSGSTPEQTVQVYNTHLFASRTLSLALEDLLIASHGAIINLTSVEMREHERSITSHPATNGGITDVTNFLRSRMAPHDVKALTVVHEAHGPGTGMSSDESGWWRDVSAFAEDILRDMSRLPGYDRAI